MVVGPGGLFVVSTKNYRGAFTRNANGVIYHNGSPTDDPRQALKQAMWLKDAITKVMGGETPWIQPILAAPFVDVRFDGSTNSVWILNDEKLLDAINPEGQKATLSGKLVQRIVRELERIQNARD